MSDDVILDEFLKQVVDRRASDGFAAVGSVPTFKVDGELTGHGDTALDADDVLAIIKASMTTAQFEAYQSSCDANYAIEHPELGRFRASAYVQREQPGLVIRRIHHEIPNFDALGLPAQLKELSLMKRGLIMIVGATGSGKSTTLYACIREINSPQVNISTMEDPVELNLEGVNQGQINKDAGFTFAAGIRALLRQDPDIMLIGEMRDEETAGMAIESALTGHFVLSTLHTNDTCGAFPRLLDMGLEPFLVTSAIKGVLAQRLVRRICKHCKEPAEVESRIKSKLRIPDDTVFYTRGG